jgi:16S rRNA (guanine966-N2)-methyltransferase
MRIISGKYKGRRFEPPKGLKARPTTDFAKEGLFNILANRIDFENIKVLDLFSGTGNIAFEFISRGALKTTCVEQYALHVRFINSVAEKINEPISVIQGDAYRFIDGNHEKYDIIFADAPYDDERLESIPERIFRAGILVDDGLLIVEHSKKTDFSKHQNFIEKRTYGNVNFSFFQLPQADL